MKAVCSSETLVSAQLNKSEDNRVVGFTTGSGGEVPGKKENL
jgi:hypothetical protein